MKGLLMAAMEWAALSPLQPSLALYPSSISGYVALCSVVLPIKGTPLFQP